MLQQKQKQKREREDLREFQEEDLPWFLAHPKSFILYEPRLGKTVVSSNIVMLDDNCKTVLIVCSKNALATWKNHLLVWHAKLCPQKTIEVRMVRSVPGSKSRDLRMALWCKPRTAEKTFYICTYGVLLEDIDFLMLPSTIKIGLRFDTVIGDEVHLRMKNRKTKTNAAFKFLTTRSWCKRFHALSGTMTSKGGPLDFWPILNMFDPKLFSSYWRFAYTFAEIIDNGWGKEIIGVKNIEAFWQLLDRYSRRRFRKVVAPQMPKVQRTQLTIQPTLYQQDLWFKLASDGFAWTGEDNKLILATTSLERILRLRQLLTCPKILDEKADVGAAMKNLVERLEDPEISITPLDKHIVIYTPFTQAIPHFVQYLKENGYHNVFVLKGGIEPEEQEEQIRQFQRTQGIMICSIKYAQAFSLCPAEQCYFIGYEYDPNDNIQAEDRLVGQSGGGHIDAFYYALEGMDEDFAYNLNIKHKLITVTIGSADNLPVKSSP